MNKVIHLTESDIMKVVSGVIKEKKTQELKSTNTLMVEIDSMLDFHYRSNSAFLKHIEDFSERFNILETFKTNIVENIFSNNTMILERFNKFSNKGVIMESTFNFQEELNGYFNFIKSSLLYQGGFINESNYNNNSLINEGGWINGVWNATVNTAKKVGNAVVSGVKAGYAALQGAWNKLKSLGVSAFMEKYRGFLTSNWGAALQILIEVSTEGFGAVIPLIAWALLAEYDMANVVAGTPNWFNLLFSLIGAATVGIASKAIGAAIPFFKTAGKSSSSIMHAIEWLAKSKFGQLFKPLVNKISAGLGKVPGLIDKAMTWVKAVFGKVFGEGVVAFFTKGANAVGKFIGELGAGIKKFFTAVPATAKPINKTLTNTIKNTPKRYVKKLVTSGLQKGANLSPKLATYLTTETGKKLASKVSVETVNILKGELTTIVKDYTEDQAISYVDKKYGKLYGDLLRYSKTAYDIAHPSNKIRKTGTSYVTSGRRATTYTNTRRYKEFLKNTKKASKGVKNLVGEPEENPNIPITTNNVIPNVKPVA